MKTWGRGANRTPLATSPIQLPAHSPALRSSVEKHLFLSIHEHFPSLAALMSSLLGLGFSLPRSVKPVTIHPSAWQLLKLSVVPKMYWNVQ